MSKAEKKTAVFYNELEHHSTMSQANEAVEVYKRAKNNLQTIIGKEIKDFKGFRKNPLAFSMAIIKETFPKPFELGLSDEATLKMLSIDLSQLEKDSLYLIGTPHQIKICDKTGNCEPQDDKEQFISYATNDLQHDRLQFCQDLISNLEKCHEYAPYRGKHNLVMGLIPFIYLDPQRGLVPNHNFVLNGIQ